jgi:hypothetical protein
MLGGVTNAMLQLIFKTPPFSSTNCAASKTYASPLPPPHLVARDRKPLWTPSKQAGRCGATDRRACLRVGADAASGVRLSWPIEIIDYFGFVLPKFGEIQL